MRNNHPEWIQELVEHVSRSIEPLEEMSELGFRVRRLRDPDCPWRIDVFPRHNEVLGGAEDGYEFVPSFRVCLNELLEELDQWHIDWEVPRDYSQGQVAIHAQGVFRDNAVLIRILDQPLRGAKVGLVINTLTGKVQGKCKQ